MTRRALCLLIPLLLVFAACGDDDGASVQSASETGSSSGSVSAAAGECEVVGGVEGDDSEIHVSLAEYSIEIEEDSAEAGIVKVEATNAGSVDHELVILPGAPSSIDVSDAGEVDESALVGEIEPFAAGTECVGSFELDAGSYTLLCAIVEESGESHYEEGMVAELEVK